jgi:hypothetical protein
MSTLTLPKERCPKTLEFGSGRGRPSRIFRCLLPSGHKGECRFTLDRKK